MTRMWQINIPTKWHPQFHLCDLLTWFLEHRWIFDVLVVMSLFLMVGPAIKPCFMLELVFTHRLFVVLALTPFCLRGLHLSSAWRWGLYFLPTLWWCLHLPTLSVVRLLSVMTLMVS
jgi:hypothetical protein